MKYLLSLICAAAMLAPIAAQEKERDIFNYVAQKNAGKEVKKIVFIADAGTHGGKGNHEFKAGAVRRSHRRWIRSRADAGAATAPMLIPAARRPARSPPRNCRRCRFRSSAARRRCPLLMPRWRSGWLAST